MSSSWSIAAPIEMVTRMVSLWKTKRLSSIFSRRPSASARAPSRVVSGRMIGELLAAVAREHLVAPDALLDDARDLLEHVVAGEVAVHVVDLLEVVDVEHQEAQVARVAARAHELLVEGLEQVPLDVHLRQTIDDGHPVDLFVVLRLDVLPAQELEDGGADLDAVAVAEARLAHDLLVVDVRAVGRPVVDAPPGAAALLEVRVPARDAVALEDDVVLGAAPDADGAGVEHEPAARGASAPSCR